MRGKSTEVQSSIKPYASMPLKARLQERLRLEVIRHSKIRGARARAFRATFLQ